MRGERQTLIKTRSPLWIHWSLNSQAEAVWNSPFITYPVLDPHNTCARGGDFMIFARSQLFFQQWIPSITQSPKCLPSLVALTPHFPFFRGLQPTHQPGGFCTKERGKWQRSERIYFLQSRWPISCLPLTVISLLWVLCSCGLVTDTLFISHFTVLAEAPSPAQLPLMRLPDSLWQGKR